MAAKGYVSHAAASRRFAGLLLLLYVLSFELIAAFALTLVLLLVDPEHTILTNPLGYLLRYGLPVALLSAFMFWRLYRHHAEAVARMLDVRTVTCAEEPRFVTIAEQACTTLGVRFPRFGVIEAGEANALTVGEGPAAGLMVATRGLLDRLDDDELLAVFAHEASHVRQGDTRILAANHALMRTALLWQVNNPFRIEQWQQLLLVILLPPMLLLLLAGGGVTMLSLALARLARRGIKLSRDHVADVEAVRVTHYPEALLSALDKVHRRGAFAGSTRVEGLLFDGPADFEGGSHPGIAERLTAIRALGAGLMDPGRSRRDTRAPVRRRFGVAAPQEQRRVLYPADADGRPLQQPPTPTLQLLALRFTDPDAYRQWQQAQLAWWEWRGSDRRNLLGIKPKLIIPVAMAVVFSLVFWWPRDGDLGHAVRTFSPGAMVEWARTADSGPFCEGPSYPDGLCPGYDYSPAQRAAKQAEMAKRKEAAANPGPPDLGAAPLLMFLFIAGMIGLSIFRPDLLKRGFGLVDATSEQLGDRNWKP
ncbi:MULTISPECIES: M48 family metallopeptidase [Sphingomonas]|uniref:M48 family metallopeptidase n=1 Tax=Sphingomonas TaxID=13687 RepID=UPI000DEF1BC9|nr:MULTISPECIES: M48 family metalloprotease [Sphingomonas]